MMRKVDIVLEDWIGGIQNNFFKTNPPEKKQTKLLLTA